VSPENAKGFLHLGSRSRNVEVLEMSRDSFSVRVPSSIAKKIAVGSKSKLLYQEMLWSVLCTHKWVGESNSVDIEFKQLAELTPPKLRSAPLTGKANQVATIGQTDPTLPVALIGGFILALLVLPAWGGKWGTSEPICGAVSATWTALSGLVTGK